MGLRDFSNIKNIIILLSYFTFHHFVKSTKSVICFENEKETVLCVFNKWLFARFVKAKRQNRHYKRLPNR
jgi:hypothetical protein